MSLYVNMLLIPECVLHICMDAHTEGNFDVLMIKVAVK